MPQVALEYAPGPVIVVVCNVCLESMHKTYLGRLLLCNKCSRVSTWYLQCAVCGVMNAAASPAAVAASLQLLRQSLPWEQLEAAAESEAQVQAQFFKGPDIKEGLAAVKEKRAPKFVVHSQETQGSL